MRIAEPGEVQASKQKVELMENGENIKVDSTNIVSE